MKKFRLASITLLLSYVFFPCAKRYFAEDVSPFLDPMTTIYFWLLYLTVTFLWILRVTVNFASKGYLGAIAHSIVSALTLGPAAYFAFGFIYDSGGALWFVVLLIPLLWVEIVDLRRAWMAASEERI